MSWVNFLIGVVPLLALVAMLCRRHYPGEAAIERIRTLLETAIANPIRKQPLGRLIRTFQIAVRGGRLIACSLAGRAPPVPVCI